MVQSPGNGPSSEQQGNQPFFNGEAQQSKGEQFNTRYIIASLKSDARRSRLVGLAICVALVGAIALFFVLTKTDPKAEGMHGKPEAAAHSPAPTPAPAPAPAAAPAAAPQH